MLERSEIVSLQVSRNRTKDCKLGLEEYLLGI